MNKTINICVYLCEMHQIETEKQCILYSKGCVTCPKLNEIARFSLPLFLALIFTSCSTQKKTLALLKHITFYRYIPYFECFWIVTKWLFEKKKTTVCLYTMRMHNVTCTYYSVHLLFLLWLLLHRKQKLHQFSLVLYIMNCYLTTNFQSFLFIFIPVVQFFFLAKKKIHSPLCQTPTSPLTITVSRFLQSTPF